MDEEWNEYHKYYKLTLQKAIVDLSTLDRLDYFQWLISLLITKKILNQGNMVKWYDKCSYDVSISKAAR